LSDWVKTHGMKGVSLWQPWSSAVALGWKTNETRSRRTHYRGPLAIHAAKQFSVKDEEIQALARDRLSAAKFTGAVPEEFPRGAIVAICTLSDCIRTEDAKRLSMLESVWGDYSPGRFVWVLTDIRRVWPIHFKASQGLFNVPAEIVKRLEVIGARG
jgi:hypothetical protein